MMTYETNISSATPVIIQFENVNEGRSYPFSDNATLIDDDGSMLPDSIIADLHIVSTPNSEAVLSSVYMSPNMLSTCIKIFTGTLLSGALSVRVKASEFEPYIPYRMSKLLGFEDIGGVITFGNIKFPESATCYRFGGRKAKFDESVVARYKTAGLRKLIDDRNGNSVSGDVKIEIPKFITASTDDDGIRLVLQQDAAESLMTKCDRERSVNACGATPIKSINGVRPDSDRRIVFWFH